MIPEDMLERLEPIIGSKARRIYLNWLLSNDDEKRELEQAIILLYLKHIKPEIKQRKVLLTPPSAQACYGDIFIGDTVYNDKKIDRFHLQQKDLCQHLAIFGRSGGGKTNTVRVLLSALLQQKIPFLLFDWKKDYSQLDFKELYQTTKVKVLPVGKKNVESLAINPLASPENTAPEVWAKKICEVLTHAYMGGPGFESIFLKAIDHCYREFGVYEGSGIYPTFLDIKEYVDGLSYSGREALWMQSVKRTIASICYGGMNQTVNSENPMNLEELTTGNFVLELDGISNCDKTLLVESVLLWLHHHSIDNLGTGKTKQVIIVEEAHHLLRAHYNDQETVIEGSMREMRSLGIGLVIVDQMPSLISKVALANTFCTIALNTKTGQDIQTLSQAMLLDDKQKEMLGMLAIGEAIVKLQDRHTSPFHLKVPHIKQGKRIINYRPPREVQKCLSQIPQKPIVTAKASKHNNRVPIQINTSRKTGARAEDQLLIDISTRPVDSVTTRYKRLGLSARKGNSLKEKLVKDELILPVTVTGRKAWIRLFEITKKGIVRLRELGAQVPSPREGGLEHQYWKQEVKEHYESQGYEVVAEKTIDGHTVDLIASKGDKVIAIEIETGKSDYMKNTTKLLHENRFSEIIVFCTSPKAEKKIRLNTKSLTDKRLKIANVKNGFYEDRKKS